MENEKEEVKEDMIDAALLDMIDEINDSDALELEFDIDDATNVMFGVIGALVDEEEIEEVPDVSKPEDVKKQWLEVSLPKIKTRLTETLSAIENGEVLGDDEEDDFDELDMDDGE